MNVLQFSVWQFSPRDARVELFEWCCSDCFIVSAPAGIRELFLVRRMCARVAERAEWGKRIKGSFGIAVRCRG